MSCVASLIAQLLCTAGFVRLDSLSVSVVGSTTIPWPAYRRPTLQSTVHVLTYYTGRTDGSGPAGRPGLSLLPGPTRTTRGPAVQASSRCCSTRTVLELDISARKSQQLSLFVATKDFFWPPGTLHHTDCRWIFELFLVRLPSTIRWKASLGFMNTSWTR